MFCFFLDKKSNKTFYLESAFIGVWQVWPTVNKAFTYYHLIHLLAFLRIQKTWSNVSM